MPKFVIVYHAQNPQRIEAESVIYDPDDKLFIFRDAAKKPVAWAPKDGIQVVAHAPVIANP